MNPILQFLLSLDIFLFRVITLGKALPGETASAAAYQGEQTGKIMGKIFRPIIDLLFHPFEKNHCRNAWHWQNHIYHQD